MSSNTIRCGQLTAIAVKTNTINGANVSGDFTIYEDLLTVGTPVNLSGVSIRNQYAHKKGKVLFIYGLVEATPADTETEATLVLAVDAARFDLGVDAAVGSATAFITGTANNLNVYSLETVSGGFQIKSRAASGMSGAQKVYYNFSVAVRMA